MKYYSIVFIRKLVLNIVELFTGELAQADNERFMYATTSTPLTLSAVCDDTSNTDFSLLINPSKYSTQCHTSYVVSCV